MQQLFAFDVSDLSLYQSLQDQKLRPCQATLCLLPLQMYGRHADFWLCPPRLYSNSVYLPHEANLCSS